ncbi:hypothetical protein N9M41_07230 [Rhodopirellula sp.]|nr:hypothetical protein [Rhodopirellula sp.]
MTSISANTAGTSTTTQADERASANAFPRPSNSPKPLQSAISSRPDSPQLQLGILDLLAPFIDKGNDA